MKGLAIPFHRASRDFATAEGEELLRAKIAQILMTEGATPRSEGEMPWRTNLGSGIHLLRHQSNTAVLGAYEACYGPEDGALSGTGRPDQRERLALDA